MYVFTYNQRIASCEKPEDCHTVEPKGRCEMTRLAEITWEAAVYFHQLVGLKRDFLGIFIISIKNGANIIVVDEI
jgi:hypothetical protein